MNKKEWYSTHAQSNNKYNKYYIYVQQLLKDWKVENNITERCVVHHRDDNDEVRVYNDAFYERWGFNEDGTFEYGKYVVFMTNVSHSKYHSMGSKNAFYGKKHTAETIEKLRVAHTGMKQSAEVIEKIRRANTGKKRTQEFADKMSIARTGENNPMYGKHHTPEAIEKIRIASTGENNPFYGKHHNDAAKAKMKGFSILWNVYKNNDGTKSYNEFKHAVKTGDITFEMQPITVFTR